jgi:hypothetical protein
MAAAHVRYEAIEGDRRLDPGRAQAAREAPLVRFLNRFVVFARSARNFAGRHSFILGRRHGRRSPQEERKMSIFGKIRDAIFGHARAAQPQQPGTPAMPQMNPAAAPAQPAHVDVDAVLADLASKKGEKLNYQSSIVDLMKLLDLDPSLANRKELATELGYTGATDGSAEMNIWLHKRVVEELEKNGGKVSAALKD